MDAPPLRIFDSPCKGICRIHPQWGWCEGCHRTRAEIGAWSTAAPMEKARILDAAAQRRDFAAKPPS